MFFPTRHWPFVAAEAADLAAEAAARAWAALHAEAAARAWVEAAVLAWAAVRRRPDRAFALPADILAAVVPAADGPAVPA